MKKSQILPRRLLLIGVILNAILLVACGQQGKDKEEEVIRSGRARWTSFPVEIYIENKIANKEEAEADILAAMDFWEKKANRKLFIFKGVWAGGDAPVVNGVVNPIAAPVNQAFYQNPWPYSSQILALNMRVEQGSKIQKSIITIQDTQNLCFGMCAGSGVNNNLISFRKVLTHEMGHFIGLNHSNDTNNIMYAFYIPNIPLEQLQVDWAELSAVLQ